VEYFTLGTRSLLSRVVSERSLPFTWAINPYRGCEFACKYCYARYTHEFMELRDGVDFERKIFVKQQAAGLLRSELKKVKRGEEIAIGTATDPYQPAERRFEITRAILEELARHSGLEIGIVTKSNMVTRDADILRKLGENNHVFVNVTVTTVNTELARKLEPRAPRPDLRLEAVRQLNLAGIDAGVICAPVLPEITDHPQDLEALVKVAKDAGAKYIYANALFLKPCSAAIFMPFLEEHFPSLVERYRTRYAERSFLPIRIRETVIATDGCPAEKTWIRERALAAEPRNAPGRRADGIVLRRFANSLRAYNVGSHDNPSTSCSTTNRPEKRNQKLLASGERRAGDEPAMVAICKGRPFKLPAVFSGL
jgi:DNA repair photolyase